MYPGYKPPNTYLCQSTRPEGMWVGWWEGVSQNKVAVERKDGGEKQTFECLYNDRRYRILYREVNKNTNFCTARPAGRVYGRRFVVCRNHRLVFRARTPSRRREIYPLEEPGGRVSTEAVGWPLNGSGGVHGGGLEEVNPAEAVAEGRVGCRALTGKSWLDGTLAALVVDVVEPRQWATMRERSAGPK